MFIQVTSTDGTKIYVNINHIEGYFQPLNEPITRINMHGDDCFEVVETPEKVTELIREQIEPRMVISQSILP